MTLIKLYKSEPTVCMSDLKLLENDIGHPLPEFFKDFYVEQNGGASDKDWWDSGDEYEPVRVKNSNQLQCRVRTTLQTHDF